METIEENAKISMWKNTSTPIFQTLGKYIIDFIDPGCEYTFVINPVKQTLSIRKLEGAGKGHGMRILYAKYKIVKQNDGGNHIKNYKKWPKTQY